MSNIFTLFFLRIHAQLFYHVSTCIITVNLILLILSNESKFTARAEWQQQTGYGPFIPAAVSIIKMN